MTQGYIVDYVGVAFAPVTSTSADMYRYLNGSNPLASPNYANNPIKRASAFWDDSFTANVSGFTGSWPPAGSLGGVAAIQPTQHADYHYRIWTIPRVITLSSPAFNSNIPFALWNTFPTSETLVSR